MKLNFKKPLVPNYIRTDKGTFALCDLDEDEFQKYIDLFVMRLKERRLEQIAIKKRTGISSKDFHDYD